MGKISLYAGSVKPALSWLTFVQINLCLHTGFGPNWLRSFSKAISNREKRYHWALNHWLPSWLIVHTHFVLINFCIKSRVNSHRVILTLGIHSYLSALSITQSPAICINWCVGRWYSNWENSIRVMRARINKKNFSHESHVGLVFFLYQITATRGH